MLGEDARELVEELLELAETHSLSLNMETPEEPEENVLVSDNVEFYRLERVPDPREFVAFVKELRDRRTIRAVSVPDPSWIPLLYYLGFDLFDAGTVLRLTLSGRLLLDDFDTEPVETDDPIDLLRENWVQLQFCFERLREALRDGDLRTLVEAVAVRNPRIAEVLRISDVERANAKHVNVSKGRTVVCSTDLSFDRPEVVWWLDRVVRYEPPENVEAVVLLPCSARKPYSSSPTHRRIIGVTRRYLVDEASVTSPLGLVPRALERVFPAAHYDVRVTGHWTAEEVERAADVFEEAYPWDVPVIAHLPRGYDLVARELKDRGYEVEHTVKDGEHPTSRRALRRLKETLNGVAERGRNPIRDHIPSAVSTFVYGVDPFADENVRFDGQRVRVNGTEVMVLVPTTGLPVPTEKGVETLIEAGVEPVVVERIPPRPEDVTVPEDVVPGLQWPAVGPDGETLRVRVIVRPEDCPGGSSPVEIRS